MREFIEISRDNCHKYLERVLEIEIVSFHSPWSHNSFLQEVKNPISHVTALVLDHSLSGYICFWLFASEIQVINIAVHPEKRNQGLGYTLMTRMIQEGMNKGVQITWLEVRESNRPARVLYEKLGFEPISRRARYYKDTDEDAIVMALRLSGKRVGAATGN